MLSLFSGIGGIDLAAQWAGIETVAFVEINPFCRAVLANHWPNVPCFEDVRDVDVTTLAGLGPIDCIAGGFPCQDVSNCGKRAGIAGERSGLWSEFYRLICEIRPQFALIENTTGLLSRGGEEFSVTLPRHGMMRNGQLFRRAPLVRHTHGSGCSFWPTLTASTGKHGWGFSTNLRCRLRMRKATVYRCLATGWSPTPEFGEWLQGFPAGWTRLG